MKYILAFLIPISLFSIAPTTKTLGDCSDGTKRTVTYIDSNNDGKYDKTLYRYCDGGLSNKPLKHTLTSPQLPEDFEVEEQVNNDCSQSGVNIDIMYHILDSNGIITHEAIIYCNIDTTYISEYIAPSMMKHDVPVGTVGTVGSTVSYEKENTFTDISEFFKEQKNSSEFKENKKFEVILVNRNNNEIFQRTFFANSNNFEKMFYNNFKINEIGEEYIIHISSEEVDYLIQSED